MAAYTHAAVPLCPTQAAMNKNSMLGFARRGMHVCMCVCVCVCVSLQAVV